MLAIVDRLILGPNTAQKIAWKTKKNGGAKAPPFLFTPEVPLG